MDVISLVRAGWRGAVAPLGTALTEPQIAELWRLAPVPVLCFDGDEAGRRAAWRAIDRVLPGLKPDHSVSVAFLPPGEDPDSLIRSRGSDAFRPVLEQAKPLAQAIWERAVEGRRLDTPEAKAGLRAVLEATAGEIGDAAVREFYRREIRQRLDQAFPWRPGVDRQRRGGFGQAGRFGGRRDGFGGAGSGHGPAPHAPGPDQGIAACILLAVVISHPTLAEEVGEALASLEMPDPSLDALKQEVIAVTAAGAGLDSQELRDHLCQTGHGRALERVAEDRIAILAPFARPAASLRQARAGWHGIWRQIEARRAGQDLKAAQDAFARDPTAENLARLRALQAQTLAAAAHGADGGAEEEYRSRRRHLGGAGASDGVGIGGEESVVMTASAGHCGRGRWAADPGGRGSGLAGGGQTERCLGDHPDSASSADAARAASSPERVRRGAQGGRPGPSSVERRRRHTGGDGLQQTGLRRRVRADPFAELGTARTKNCRFRTRPCLRALSSAVPVF